MDGGRAQGVRGVEAAKEVGFIAEDGEGVV